jgi:hypothetical protein
VFCENLKSITVFTTVYEVSWDPILSQIIPAHTIFMAHPNIIFPSIPRSSKYSLPFTILNQNFLFISKCYYIWHIMSPSHSQWLNHYNNIWGKESIWNSSLCSFLQSPTTLCVAILKIHTHPQFMSEGERTFTPMHNTRQNYSFTYFTI